MKFEVIDTKTGKYPDLWKIARKEDWAKSLCYCDMEGFAIEEDGTLILLDECGRHGYCPEGRFKIVPVVETNRDSLMAMSDKELAEFLNHDILGEITRGFKSLERWLKAPVGEKDEESIR